MSAPTPPEPARTAGATPEEQDRARCLALAGAAAGALAPALDRGPARAAAGLRRVLERAADPVALVEGLAAAGALGRALALLGLGGAPVEAFLAEPRDLLAVAAVPDPTGVVAAARAAADAADGPPERAGEAALEALRTARRRATLALAAHELGGDLEATAAAAVLSRLADLVLADALALAREAAARRTPAARDVRLCVLALGKLGGVELNYSSDVDLVLVRADDAPQDAAEAVGRALVGAVQATTAAGRLYRVDLRLRPHGGAGALAPRVAAMVEYYREHGRTWERQALLKARPAAGDLDVGEDLLARLAPWLWRPSLDARALRDVLALRDRIARVDDAARDVKVGPGGIRDVEFTVQALQLLHGGRDPQVRTTNTRAAVEALLAAGALSADEARDLREGYGFVRRLEHLLQLTCDREQTRLPRGPALEPLAQALGLAPAALEARLADAQRRTRGVLDRLLRAPFRHAEAAPDLDAQDLLLAPDPDPARVDAVLRARGLRDPAAAWRTLEALARERSFLGATRRARTLLAGLLPRLLEQVGRTPDPDRTLRNLERATATLGARAGLYELWAAQPDALGLFVALAAGSDVLVEMLARHPGVVDEVIDRLRTRTPLRRADIEREARLALEGPAAAAGLREVRALSLLLAGVLDLGGRANVRNTGRALADGAEGLLRALLAHATAQTAARHGGAPPGGLVLLALGKLGARELAWGSDLDLVAVYDPGGDAQAPDGAPAAKFWGEVVQALLTLAQGDASPEGPLLALDLRLRPHGASAPLAASLEAARAYYGAAPAAGDGGGGARHFERLALQKARVAAGDEALGPRVEAALADALYGRAYGPRLWDEIAEMRRRQVEHAAKDDLKRGRGSLADVELLASGLALAHGGRAKALRVADTGRLLEAAAREGLLAPAEHLEVRTAYAFLRRLELRLRAEAFARRPVLPPPGPARRDLAHALGYVDEADPGGAEAALAHEVEYHRERIRSRTAAVLERERVRAAS